jgi:hypothetical protein
LLALHHLQLLPAAQPQSPVVHPRDPIKVRNSTLRAGLVVPADPRAVHRVIEPTESLLDLREEVVDKRRVGDVPRESEDGRIQPRLGGEGVERELGEVESRRVQVGQDELGASRPDEGVRDGATDTFANPARQQSVLVRLEWPCAHRKPSQAG